METTNETVVWKNSCAAHQLRHLSRLCVGRRRDRRCRRADRSGGVLGAVRARGPRALVALRRAQFLPLQGDNDLFGLTRGVLTKRTDSIELYRVKDTTLIEPFPCACSGLSNVMLNCPTARPRCWFCTRCRTASRCASRFAPTSSGCACRKFVRRSGLRAGALATSLPMEYISTRGGVHRKRFPSSCSKASRPTAG